MKTEFVTRSIYAKIIILIATMAISGCIILPVVETTGAKPGTIRAGTTSRAKIMTTFGYPSARTVDGRFLLYDYSKDTEWCYQYVYGGGSSGPGGQCTSNLLSEQGWVLIEFDNDNIVEQHLVHTCRNPPDPLCDQPGTDTMWVMINQMAGEDVAILYGETLDEFRQAEALRNSRTEALVEAVKLADLEEVKRLIDEGADVNAENRNGYLLHKAAWNGHVGVIKLLLANGANVNLRDTRGKTPLHEAVLRDNQEGVAELLANGADVNARDSNGETPLHIAVLHITVWSAHVSVIRLLLAKGVDVNVRDGWGNMPLHLAIRIGDTEVVQLLLTHGADANAKAKGWFNRPIKIARDLGGREDIIELLKQHGGKE